MALVELIVERFRKRSPELSFSLRFPIEAGSAVNVGVQSIWKSLPILVSWRLQAGLWEFMAS